jgi:uncharacterized alpha-E superfamily protein
MDELTTILDQLSGEAGRECKRLAGEMHSSLHYGRIEDIFRGGLHEFLEAYLRHNNRLGLEIQRAYLNAPTSKVTDAAANDVDELAPAFNQSQS